MASNLSFSPSPSVHILLFLSPLLFPFPFMLSSHWLVFPFFFPLLTLMAQPYTISTWTGLFQPFPPENMCWPPVLNLQDQEISSHCRWHSLGSLAQNKVMLLKLNPSRSLLAILENGLAIQSLSLIERLLQCASPILVIEDTEMKEIILCWICTGLNYLRG